MARRYAERGLQEEPLQVNDYIVFKYKHEYTHFVFFAVLKTHAGTHSF